MSSIIFPDGREIGTGTHARFHANKFVAKPLGTYSIAGAQPKVVGDFIKVDVTGVVQHVRGDDPKDPTRIGFFVVPDAGTTPEGHSGTEHCDRHGADEVIVMFHPVIQIDIIPAEASNVPSSP